MSWAQQIRITTAMLRKARRVGTLDAARDAAGAFLALALHPKTPRQMRLSVVKLAMSLAEGTNRQAG